MSDVIYNIAAIPTIYGGVNFRSRLEARWAVMFDSLGWRWAYEPLDLHGWIPDFVLHGVKERVLVEVKPTFDPPLKLFSEVSKQSRASGAHNDILVLGADLPKPRQNFTAIGWLGQFYRLDVEHEFGLAETTEWNGRVGFRHETLMFRDRIHGHAGLKGSMDMNWLDALWREAGNRVQWQPKRAA